MRKPMIACCAALAFIPLGAASAEARVDAGSKSSVTVRMSEFKFALSKKAAARGVVVFSLRNAGHVPHDFKIASKTSRVLNHGGKGTLSVTFRKPGRYPYVCTLPGHAEAGMKGVLVVR